MTRRRALAVLAAAVAQATLLLSACGRGARRVFPPLREPEYRSGEATSSEGKMLDPIESIPENSIEGPQDVPRASYRLRIHGLVERPREWRYDEVLERFPKVERVLDMDCVEGWSRTLLRDGVRLRAVLEDAGVKPDAAIAIFRAADGYSTSLPLRHILERDLMLAFMVNDLTLPPERGFPFQVMAEGKWGYKSCKWVEEIELSSDTGFRGYWESRGFSNEAPLGEPFTE